MKTVGATGRTFHRTRAQRLAMFRGLATSLIENGSLITTHSKAKSLVPYIERMISKAIKGGMRNKQLVARDIQTDEALDKLFAAQEIFAKRVGGHVRVVPQGYRKGDNSKMSKIEFVDDINKVVKPKAEPKTKATPAKKVSAKQPAKKKTTSPKKETDK